MHTGVISIRDQGYGDHVKKFVVQYKKKVSNIYLLLRKIYRQVTKKAFKDNDL